MEIYMWSTTFTIGARAGSAWFADYRALNYGT